MINWKVRIKNKTFWKAMIPAMILLIQAVASVFGFTIDLSGIAEKLLCVIEALFVALALIGIVVDPTTEGTSDSAQALTYEAPKKNKTNI